MQKVALLSHQVIEPSPLSIKIVTEWQELQYSHEISEDTLIARLFLYTPLSVYRGNLCKSHINSQLNWSSNSFATLIDVLSGKKSGITICFNEVRRDMSFICQIQTGIRITFFELNFDIVQAYPLPHMRQVLLTYKNIYQEEEKKLKTQKEHVNREIKQIEALGKQIQEQTLIQVTHMKKNFLDIINRCKAQLRRHMKTGISEIPEEEEEEDRIKSRTILKVKRETSHQRGLESLFDKQ